MGPPEYVGRLHRNGRQFVDIEKAAIVNLVEGCPPMTKPKRLLVEQTVECVDRMGIVFTAVVTGDTPLNIATHRFASRRQLAKSPLDNFFFALAFSDRCQIARRLRWQMHEGCDDALQLD